MTPAPLLAQWLGAWLTGLAASAHCFGMCGGLQAALAPAGHWSGLWRLQLGRTLAYAAVGAVTGGLSGLLGQAFSMTLGPLARGLRWIAVGIATLALLGLAWRVLGQRDLFRLERLGTGLWRLVQPLGRRAGFWGEPWRSLALGGLWAFIPCALVLSMATLAATTGSAWRGAALMTAFALGTWPALLGAAWFGRELARSGETASQGRRAAVVAGLLLLAGAQVALLLAPVHHHGGMGGKPAPTAADAPVSMPAGHEPHHHHALP